MPEQDEIYQHYPSAYEQLVSHEDYQGNILTAVEELIDLRALEVADLGSGTGRFLRMLAPYAGLLLGLDRSLPMLRTSMSLSHSLVQDHWALAAAENSHLPLSSERFDLVIAGWTFGHATVWYEEGWREKVVPALGEMLRVLKPGGLALIFETMGTNAESPAPPTERLGDYYRFLEREMGFAHRVLETDYRFDSQQQARELIRFFFGEEMGSRVVSRVVPEWTGLWWYWVS